MNTRSLGELQASPKSVSDGIYRRLFYNLVNVEKCTDLTDQARSQLDPCLRALGQNQGFDVDCLIDTNALSSKFESTRIDLSSIGALDRQQRDYVLQQFAPIVLTDGAWLRSSFQAVNGHTPVSAELFRAYKALKASNQPYNLISRYLSVIRQYGINMPAIYTRAFSQQSNIQDLAFRGAAIQLCLTYCARRYQAEIIGYTIARAFDPVLWRMLCRLASNAASNPTDESSDRGLQTSCVASLEAHLKPYKNTQELADQYRRIGLGIGLYEWIYGILVSGLLHDLGNMPNKADEAFAILRRKAKFARGYHQSIRINGRSLDAWLESGLTDGDAFLTALAESDYFDRDNPENSRFIKASISADGPMFGVFSSSEIDTILSWFRSGSNTPSRHGGVRYEDVELVQPTQSCSNQPASKTNVAPRELYYRLVNWEFHKNPVPSAKRYVDRCLRMALLQSKWSRNQQCFSYDHQHFDSYVQALYRREMAAYKPVIGHPRFSEEVYRWGIEQFAPTLLVDGCWLQNIERLCDYNPEVGERLGAIYADEIGSGRCADNHANVYRCLLDSLEIQLPDLDSREFAYYPGFLHSAFDLPAYFLAISQFPQSYLPEILGLNMAIELSGLGASYMRLAESLEYWGIDAKIVRLHLSIDNLASGHSAIAKEAIGIYLDQINANSGAIAMQRHWRRIWTGYVSLSSVPRLFKWALVFGYFKNFRRFGF